MPLNVDPAILAAFHAEARGYLPKILEGLASLSRDPRDVEARDEVHRLVHTIKGASSMLGLQALSHVAYFMEEALEDVPSGRLALDERVVGLFQATVQHIESYLDDALAGGGREREILAAVVRAYRRLRNQPESGDAAAVTALLGPEAAPRPAAAAHRPGASRPVETPEPSADLLDAFQAEAEEHLATLGRLLPELERRPDDAAVGQDVRRIVHTLKGAAAMVGLPTASRLAHRMEDVLDRMHEGAVASSSEISSLLYRSVDLLEDLVRGVADDASLTQAFGRYAALLGDDEAEAGSATAELSDLGEEGVLDLAALVHRTVAPAASAEVSPRSPARPSSFVRVPIDRLDELVKLVSELVISRSTFEQHFRAYGRQVEELAPSVGRLRRVASRLEREYEVVSLAGRTLSAPSRAAFAETPAVFAYAGGPAPRESHGFDDLELDRYTEFHLLSRELTETSADIGAVASQFRDGIGDFEAYRARLGRLTGEIQDRLMRLRMVPLATLASRLHRAVRVTATQQGKEAELALLGGDVALDKTVLEEMADPFLHLLRNAVDHGVEPPAVRQALGKPAAGRIRVVAAYEGSQVALAVSDDGAGLVPERLREGAVRGGFATEEEAARMTAEELHTLVFRPGFSTAREVSEVSGRGVGMDVVRATVERMKGTISVASTPGRGATFTIRLPLTLAISRVLLVRAAGELFAMPLASVTQILRVEREELARLGEARVLAVEGAVFPVVRLADILELRAAAEEAPRRLPLLIVQAGSRRVALVVERIVEARDVVVKSLGSPLRKVRGISGATLLGDGSVVLILDPLELVGEAPKAEAQAEPAAASAASPRAAAERRALTVLVVDDSLSVRHVLANSVRSVGWNPVTAKDGVDALEVLQRLPALPDVVLLDIEMPRMDGYELLSTLRGQPATRDLPVVMITSRASEKHRLKAIELGVNGYLVKPYQQEELLATIRRLVERRGASPA